MYNNIPVLTKCCCCLSSRDGILICAYLRLVGGMMTLGVGVILFLTILAFAHPDTVTYLIILGILITISIDVVSNLILIIGCHKKNAPLLRVYCICGIVYAVTTIILFIVWFVRTMLPTSTYGDDNHQITKNWSGIGLIAAFVTSILFVHLYIMILVRSELLRLGTNCQFRFINHTADPECFLQPQEHAIT